MSPPEKQSQGQISETHDLRKKGNTNLLSSTLYSLQTLYLFTLSDHSTFVTPQTAFGIFGALSGPVLTTNPSPDLFTIAGRLPQTLLWTWLNTLVFVLGNQRLPESAKEDSLNKPWRPLPAGRITTRQATHLLMASIPLTFVATYFLGGLEETVALFVFDWMYNDLGGSDESYIIRNLLIAAGYVCYSAGAMRVASGHSAFTLLPVTYQWLGMIAAVILSTMHVQDLKDQEGDHSRERKTLPLVIGHWATRCLIASAVLFWSIACPLFWGLGLAGYALSGISGAVVATRALLLRDTGADRLTWKLWSLWLMGLYFLPLVKDYSVFVRFGAQGKYAENLALALVYGGAMVRLYRRSV
ncbi:hypothetical protein MMC30_000452 [Trapelia coarctata]|nr:hypothetical protein [Trapelia coarctata]